MGILSNSVLNKIITGGLVAAGTLATLSYFYDPWPAHEEEPAPKVTQPVDEGSSVDRQVSNLLLLL